MNPNLLYIAAAFAVLSAPAELDAGSPEEKHSDILREFDWGEDTPVDACDWSCCTNPAPETNGGVQMEIFDINIPPQCEGSAFAVIHHNDVACSESMGNVVVDTCHGVAFFHADDLPQSPFSGAPWVEILGAEEKFQIQYYFCGRTDPYDVLYPCTPQDRL